MRIGTHVPPILVFNPKIQETIRRLRSCRALCVCSSDGTGWSRIPDHTSTRSLYSRSFPEPARPLSGRHRNYRHSEADLGPSLSHNHFPYFNFALLSGSRDLGRVQRTVRVRPGFKICKNNFKNRGVPILRTLKKRANLNKAEN